MDKSRRRICLVHLGVRRVNLLAYKHKSLNS
jgi:hypothetical protein